MNTIQKIVSFLFLLLSISVGLQAQNFSTQGNGIRDCITANVNGEEVLYISEVDGALSCYSIDGKEIWSSSTQTPAVMFEIVAADLDQDGNEDLLAASGDGHIYARRSNGDLLWKFNPGHKVRFNEVAVMDTGDEIRIFAGGNDYHIYEIDVQGKLVMARPIGGSVRKLEVGDFVEEGVPCLFVYTLKHDKFRSEFFGFIHPEHFVEVLKSTTIQKVLPQGGNRFMLQDFSIADINKDGRDDLVMFGSSGGAVMVAVDGDFNRIAEFKGPKKDAQRYAYCYGTPLLPVKDEIIMQFGGVMYGVDLKGSLLRRSGSPHRGIIYNDLVCGTKSDKLIGAGQIGGGNGLYFYDLNDSEWWNTKQVLLGRMAEVDRNLASLYQEAIHFKLPEYQSKKEKSFNMITSIPVVPEVQSLSGGNLNFIKQYAISENTDRQHMVDRFGEMALRKDRRKKYDMSREDVVDMARGFESKGQPFVIWAGHGTDPFYLQIETLEQILEVAPNTCHGFIYAEIHNPKDPRVVYWVNEYLPRLAYAIRKNGNMAKLYFRYKSMFWAATVHAGIWKDVFFSGKYRDILVPSAEDTNNRLQDLNFSGRVGMFAGGFVDDWAIRLVDDNPTSWRPYSPGGQRSVSPYLRNGVSMISYGARYGILFNIGYLENPGMSILFALMKSGLLPVVEKEDILSIGSWHLMQDVDEAVVRKADDGHNLMNYNKEDLNAIVSVNSVTWCGTSIPDYDYSKISLGVNYRWLNFIPKMPHGMVPVAPVEIAQTLEQRGDSFCVSDTKHGFVNGLKIEAEEFAPIMQGAVERGRERLLLTVEGASWSLIRIDDHHARLVLVDPGYIDPQEREVVVSIQNLKPVNATDILSGEAMSIQDDKFTLIVPAGSLRFIDLEYAEKI